MNICENMVDSSFQRKLNLDLSQATYSNFNQEAALHIHVTKIQITSHS